MTDPNALAPSELPGTGARCAVHADRAARVTCTRCGNFACEECETRSDSGAVVCKACESAGEGGDIPWEKRAELGIGRAFVQTTLAVLMRPWEFFLLRAREASILPVILFAWIVTTPSTVLGTISNLLSLDSTRQQLLANPFAREMLWMVEPPFYIGMGVVSLLLFPLVLGLYTVIWHLTLMPFAAAKRPIKETARALGYVHVVYLPMIAMLPFVTILNVLGLPAIGGAVVFPFVVYAYAMSGIAMWKTHRVDGWRIFAAVGLQIVGFFAFSCVLGALFAAVIISAMGLPLR